MPEADRTVEATSEYYGAVVILNGPSRLGWTDYTFTQEKILGCNWAFRDWPLTDCACVDKTMVRAVDEYFNGSQRPCEFWTKNHPAPYPGWRSQSIPGIDSGSYAIELALQHTRFKVLVIGADGILGGEHQTAYTYSWQTKPPNERIHQIHRQTVVKLNSQYPDRLRFVWPQLDSQLKTLPIDQAKMQITKYSINEVR